ncbi:TRAP transporter substrate-binding protein DctP [Bosea sp. (in: a-proteobacteria)]|jgi:TRAP-type C4-dicarboxylate transport system substrate-binding protein|uniref:TRAP transporter substrate-binding protein DctP n=1 Tax=Bosea sp. (in: a-proteobacteria) TaxID=1871050 RepID=UPI003F6E6A0A
MLISRTAAEPRQTHSLLAAFVGAVFAVGVPGMAQAQKIDLTMGIIVSPGDAYSAMTASVPERVAKATNGRVSVTVSDSLVAPAQIASAVRDGRLPMSASLHTYLAADEPRMGIFNLPGLINNVEEYQKVRDAFWAKDVAKIWEEKWGAVVLAEGAWCPTRLFSKTPIRTVEDFKNKRLRVHNPQTAAQMNALGAKPTPMATTEIMPALERGVIDGVFISTCVGGAMEFWRLAKNVQDWGVGAITGWAILINKAEWEGMPADVRAQVQSAMDGLQKDAFGTYNAFVQSALDNMKKHSVEPWSASEQERAVVNDPKYAKAAYDSWLARAKEVGFDGPAYINQVRQALGKPTQ